jgi:iron complex outermembrane recepter protein
VRSAGFASLLAALTATTTAQAAPPIAFAVPPGPLRSTIVTVGDQAAVTIGLSDPFLANVPTRGVRGRMTVTAALTRLLAGTPADFEQADPQTFRIVHRRVKPRPLPTARPPIATNPPSEDSDAIVVTGSKRSAPFADYPGTVTVLDTRTIRPNQLADGSTGLVDRLPTLTSTHLGPGRNKLFIRGIADSSFNGPSQAVVGQYLGDVRLNYNAPDPDLALYDISSVEVLEGPQGTLYGAGSLGGIVRLTPTPVDLDHTSTLLSAGASAQAHGVPGGDAAAVLNLPLVSGRLGLRAVGYGSIEGGYIDDPGRGRSDINRTVMRGGRATLRFQPAPDWSIELGGVTQDINSRDGQYTLRGSPPLQRSSILAQPFDNDYGLTSLIVRHDMGATKLVSATSAVFHDVDSTYDASRSAAQPLRYHEANHIRLVENETRLSRSTRDGGSWVVGVELLHSSGTLERSLGPPDRETAISGTANKVDEASLFGEATIALSRRIFATGGLRLGFTRVTGDPLDPMGADVDHGRHQISTLPSAGLLWKVAPWASAYVRYEEGYRPGGLSVEANDTQRFEADSLATWEAGVRLGSTKDPAHLTMVASYAHWKNIQADLVDTAGLPYTSNIGTGRVIGLEIAAGWRPMPAFALDAALFYNDSALYRPAPAFVGEADASLPNIADLVARIGGTYALSIGGRRIELSGSLRYVGRSRLGVGPIFDVRQGGFFDTAFGVSVPVGRAVASLDATNLLDKHGNVFALGNPFGVAMGQQTTPLRPTTIRLGLSFGF